MIVYKIISVLFVGCAAIYAEEILKDNVKFGYINQKLDHFNAKDKRTFNQYYWANTKYHKKNGPVFLLLEGEGPTKEDKIDTATGWQWTEYGKKYGAAMFELEHRFFGKTIPLNSYNTENLKFLNSRQALEDIAGFVKEMNKLYNFNNAKWVVFGGSYAGSLTAWIRQEHPELIAGAVSSSGPVLAKINYQEYNKVVNESFWNYSPDCVKEIDKAFRKVEQMLTTEQGRKDLKEKLDLCAEIAENPTKKDIGQLFAALIDIFQGIAQYGGDNRGLYATNLTIPTTCRFLQDSTTNPDVFDRLAIMSRNNFNFRKNPTKCLENRYNEEVKRLAQDDPYQYDMKDRGWQWICCGEMGWFFTTDHPLHPFGNHNPLEFHLNQCRDIFGEQWSRLRLQKSVASTNKHYGGQKHFKGTNVIFLNGLQDPAHQLGIYDKPPNPGTITILMKGAAHCGDMYASREKEKEIESVLYARSVIEENIQKWIE